MKLVQFIFVSLLFNYSLLATADDCTDGQYLVEDTCTACPSDQDGTNTPIANSEHTQCVADASSCGAGEFATTNQCKICEAGTIEKDDHSGCLSCPLDEDSGKTKTFANVAHTECIEKCGDGEKFEGSQCVKCKENEYALVDHSDCVDAITKCGEGNYHKATISPDGQCVKCESATPVANSDHTGCVADANACADGEIVINNQCTPCGKGEIPNNNRNECTPCGDGYIVESKKTCKKCEGGNPIANFDQTSCETSCGSDEIKKGGNQCAKCGKGEIPNTTTNTCDKCENGKIVDGLQCKACSEETKNKFANLAQDECVEECGDGEMGASNQCTTCPEEKPIAKSDHSDCVADATECGDGEIVDKDSKQCTKCEANEYATFAHNKCGALTDCGAGEYAKKVGNTNIFQCTPCEAGKIPKSDKSECQACPDEKPLVGSDKETCTDKCGTNEYKDGTTCVSACPNGKVPNDNKECECDPDKHTAIDEQTGECTECAKGYEKDDKGDCVQTQTGSGSYLKMGFILLFFFLF